MPPTLFTRPHRYDRARLVVGLIAPLLALLLVATACGDDEVADDTTTTTQAPADDTTTTAPDGDTETTQPASDDVPECDEAAISTLLTTQLGSDGNVDRVEITDCAGGFARAIVIPVADNLETEQVFLRAGDSGWEIVDFGTGIECGDPDLADDMVAACEALGLP
ncbi:MAG: hypothetical protein ACXIVQ_14740 [Acidimicrobiales bacterium]